MFSRKLSRTLSVIMRRRWRWSGAWLAALVVLGYACGLGIAGITRTSAIGGDGAREGTRAPMQAHPGGGDDLPHHRPKPVLLIC